ncbi:MAG TPA: peptidoglycan-binding protein [Actinomycetota bacterium]|nr:peptidoglycan-binding protein [Actinomycetota bacterium]
MAPVLLQNGSSGDQVRQLQQALLAAGYDPTGVDGVYGPGTETAVRRFQGERGLDADGIVGPRTWEALTSIGGAADGSPAGGLLRPGSSGARVRQLQQALLAAGYDPAGVDGVYGPGTETAVRRFQGERGLDADGIVGPRTWEALTSTGGAADGGAGIPTPGGGPPSEGGLSTRGAEFIARHEGCRLQLYNDPVGHCTIGVGHLVHHGPCSGSEPAEFLAGISRERAFELLQADAASAARAVLGAVSVSLGQHELDALISFTFNVGGGAFQGSTLVKKLNAGQRGEVPGELARWTKASGKELPGLVTRRTAEGRLFSAGEY